MRLATMRRDGFASMDAASDGGQLTTRPVRFSGAHLFVNADAAEGELLRNGAPRRIDLPGGPVASRQIGREGVRDHCQVTGDPAGGLDRQRCRRRRAQVQNRALMGPAAGNDLDRVKTEEEDEVGGVNDICFRDRAGKRPGEARVR